MTFSEGWANFPRTAKGLTILFGTMASVAGAITAVNAAWPTMEPWLAAHRGYVRDHTVQESAKIRAAFAPTRLSVIEVQLSIARNRKSQIRDRLLTLEIELIKAVGTEDKVRKQHQIGQLQEEFTELNTEIKALLFQREH